MRYMLLFDLIMLLVRCQPLRYWIIVHVHKAKNEVTKFKINYRNYVEEREVDSHSMSKKVNPEIIALSCRTVAGNGSQICEMADLELQPVDLQQR
jgi:hypothetical protein